MALKWWNRFPFKNTFGLKHFSLTGHDHIVSIQPERIKSHLRGSNKKQSLKATQFSCAEPTDFPSTQFELITQKKTTKRKQEHTHVRAVTPYNQCIKLLFKHLTVPSEYMQMDIPNEVTQTTYK